MKVKFLVFIICFLCSLVLSYKSTKLEFNSPTEKQSSRKHDFMDDDGVFFPVERFVPFTTTIVKHGERLEKISIVDQTYGWCASKKNLFRTTDGGSTWQEMKLTIPQETFIDQIHFINRSLGWVVLQKHGEIFKQSGSRIIWLLKTNDGGETWNEMYKNESIEAVKLKFSDEFNGWFMGIKYDKEGCSSFILNTNNQGKSWNDVSSEFIKTASENKKIHDNRDVALRVIQNGNEATIITGTKAIIKTSNGGRSWKLIDIIEEEKTPWSESTGIVDFGLTDDEQKWAIDAGGCAGPEFTISTQTRDGVWKKRGLLSTRFTDAEYLFGNAFLISGSRSKNIDGVVREVGVIHYTLDTGKPWITIYESSEAERVTGINVIGNEIWAICNNGSLVKLNLPSPTTMAQRK